MMYPVTENDDLPILTDIVEASGDAAALPVLTEVIVDADADTGLLPAGRTLGEADMQRLLDHFSAHLETVLSDKISHYLQDLHHQAIKLAVLELQSELPELLRRSLAEQDTPQAD